MFSEGLETGITDEAKAFVGDAEWNHWQECRLYGQARLQEAEDNATFILQSQLKQNEPGRFIGGKMCNRPFTEVIA